MMYRKRIGECEARDEREGRAGAGKEAGDRESLSKEPREQERRLKAWMAKVKHKIVVLSGKGGVGKSTVTVNLAFALAWKGYKVGVLDADITGPSIPKMLGLRGRRLVAGPPGIFPASGPLGIKVVSMDFLLPSDETPVIWRGPLKSVAIRQFLADVVWGELDRLLVDLPPGTGDESLSILQLIPSIDGAIIVTIPSEVSQIVVKKAVTFARELGVPIIGIVENMSGFVCPKCGAKIDILKVGGGRRMAEELNAPFLGWIPIEPKVCEDSDRGVPFILRHPNSAAARAFLEIVERTEGFLKRRESPTGKDRGA